MGCPLGIANNEHVALFFCPLWRLVPRPLGHIKALPCSLEGRDEPCLVVSWDELSVVLKKAKKGSYNCWELYGDGSTSPSKVRRKRGEEGRL